MAQATPTRPSLTVYLLSFVLMSALLSAGILLAFGERRVNDYERDILEAVAERRASAIAELFARAITADWRQLSSLSARLEGTPPSEIRAQLDLIVGNGRRISWAGFAGPDGTIVSASGGLLEGQSVAARPWFQRGLTGAFAGDVHEAVLLAEKLPRPEGGGTRRFLDLSTPVPGGDPSVPSGVLGVHINEQWAQDYLRETGAIVGADAAIVSRDGMVVLGSQGLVGQRFDLQSIRSAMAGAGSAVVETWPDGRAWMTSVVPEVAYGELPSFGWSLVARVDPNTFSGASAGLSAVTWVVLATLGTGLSAASLLFARIFLRPIRQLAESANAIAEGADCYPHETRGTREASILSTALARIEHRLAASRG